MTRRPYHPTDLTFASRYCGHALSLREQGAPYDERPYEVGIAAHACLEHIALVGARDGMTLTDAGAAVVTRDVCERLIARGREWNGKPEPPMSPDAVWKGRKLALDWHSVEPVSKDARVEVPLVSYDGEAELHCIIDYILLERHEDEEGCANRLIVRDYKSAWSTDASELDTLQRKAQAVCVLADEIAAADADVIQLEVVNLRTRQKFVREVWLDEAGSLEIRDWWRDIKTTIWALESQRDPLGNRPAVVGAHCVGCPYVSTCEAAQAFYEACDRDVAPSALAAQYVAATAMRDELAELLKAACDEQGVELAGGVVGYQAKPQRRLTRHGVEALVDEWEAGRGDLRGFAVAADLSVSNAEAVCKLLYPNRADRKDRDEFIAAITETVYQKRFGIHRA